MTKEGEFVASALCFTRMPLSSAVNQDKIHSWPTLDSKSMARTKREPRRLPSSVSAACLDAGLRDA